MRRPLASCLILLGSLIWLSAQTGCAHYYLPASQLETPEATGPDRIGRLELVGIQSGTDLLNASTESLVNYAFGVSFAITPALDLGLKLEPFAPVLVRAKYQFWGAPESQAHSGNFSASISGSSGLLLSTYNGSSVTFYSFNAAVIGGYRFAEHHLASLAPFFSLAGISGIGNASGTTTLAGASLGYQYDAEALILRAELTWASSAFYPGLLLGLKL